MQDKELGAEGDLDFFATSSLALSKPELTFQSRPETRETCLSGAWLQFLGLALPERCTKVALGSLLVALLGRTRRC